MQLFGNSGARWTTEDNYFAKGGEGELYNLVGYSDLVAKIYKDGALNATRQEKLIYMSSIYSSERLQQLAWPKDVLKDSYGNVKGFIMRRFSATKDLADLLDGTSKSTGDNIDWLKRIVISLNLSHLVNEIHSLGQVIGDMNPKNFGVDMTNGFVCAFDTDSFHLRDTNTGKWYPCTVLDEHYIAPEFQARLKQGGRVDAFRPEETFTRETDNFALAVLIFQLLFNGVHPFTAARIPTRGSSVVIHTRETNIYQRMSPFFNPSANTTIPVYAPPLSIVPSNVQEMFRKAFLQDVRPTAQEWAAALSSLVLQTEKCSKGHYYGRYNSKCPWCEMDEKIRQAKAASSSSSSARSSSSTKSASTSTTRTTTTASATNTSAQTAHNTSSTQSTPTVTTATTPTKKKSGWGVIFAAITILVIVVIAISNSTVSNRTNNSLGTGNNSNNNRLSQGTRPTTRPTSKPTIKPTSTPRTFAFDSTFDVTKGVVKITWTDSKSRGPYTVTYQYINNSSSVEQTTYRLGDTYNKYMECPYFIPGSKYLVTVKDNDGYKTTTTFTYSTANTFSDDKLKASSIKFTAAPRSISFSAVNNDNWSSAKTCQFSAKKMESDISSKTNHYGLRLTIAYPQLSYSRSYQTLIAYYAPNGYVDSYSSEVSYDKGNSDIYWNIHGIGFFDDLYDKFGKIPTGSYTVKLFFNGQSVSSQSFSVNN